VREGVIGLLSLSGTGGRFTEGFLFKCGKKRFSGQKGEGAICPREIQMTSLKPAVKIRKPRNERGTLAGSRKSRPEINSSFHNHPPRAAPERKRIMSKRKDKDTGKFTE